MQVRLEPKNTEVIVAFATAEITCKVIGLYQDLMLFLSELHYRDNAKSHNHIPIVINLNFFPLCEASD